MFGLVGHNISYTFSPEIHQALGYTYEVFDMNEDELDIFMKAKNFKGINVTIPYKQKIIEYCDELDESAKALQVVNTIVNIDGKLIGYNTDTRGFKFALDHYNVQIKDKKVLILGSGSTSQSITSILETYDPKIIACMSRKGDLTYDHVHAVIDYEIIINTTPVGVFPHLNESALDLKPFTQLEQIIDVIYNPLRTQLVSEAISQHIPAYGGLMMLVAQAVFSSEIFFNKTVDKRKIVDVFNQLLKQKENIVLIGMPAAGKSSLAKRLSEKMNRDFFDVDACIEEKTGQPISSIFEQYGESHFRKLESEVISDLSLKQGIIIATGGGSILNDQNVKSLKQNGILYFVDRDLDALKIEAHRPLARNKSALQALYTERYPHYQSAMDTLIDNNKTLDDATAAIIKEHLCAS